MSDNDYDYNYDYDDNIITKKTSFKKKIAIGIVSFIVIGIISIIIYFTFKNKSSDNNIIQPTTTTTSKSNTIYINDVVNEVVINTRTSPSIQTTTTTTQPIIRSSYTPITYMQPLLNYDVSKLVSTSKINISTKFMNLSLGQIGVFIGAQNANNYRPFLNIPPLYSLSIFLTPDLNIGFRRRSYDINNKIILQQTIINRDVKLLANATYYIAINLSNFKMINQTLTDIDYIIDDQNKSSLYPVISTANLFCNINMSVSNNIDTQIITIPDTITWYNDFKFDSMVYYKGTELAYGYNISVQP
jgi:hypothetical protein